MKYSKVENLIVIVIALSLLSCGAELKNGPSDFDRHIMCIDIVKFSSPEYSQYVVAEKVAITFDTIDTKYGYSLTAKEYGYKIRSDGGVYQELFLGKSPYIELPNNYFIVDWKWGDFIYEPSNILLNVKWDEVQDRQEIWEIDSKIVTSHFITSWGSVSREDIDKYLNITHSVIDSDYNIPAEHVRPWFLGKYNSISEMSDSIGENYTLKEYQQEVQKQDSLQNIYVERIAQLIEEGALERVANMYNVK